MSIHRFLLSDFVSVQRQSFFELLEKGLIEEFAKRNPIINKNNNNSFFFYPEYYILTRPQYKPHEAILKNKSYTSKLFVPVQITNRTQKQVVLKWVYIGNIPLMTKRGHFILNGAARVIVNQILRSPGIYYQEKIYENYEDNKGTKSKTNVDNNSTSKNQEVALQPENSYKRYYCDLICMRGSWLRIEMDKEKNIWAQMKKGPKIPIYWFLLAMGLSEKIILKSIPDFQKVLGNLEKNQTKTKNKNSKSFVPETLFPGQSQSPKTPKKKVSLAEEDWDPPFSLKTGGPAETKLSKDHKFPLFGDHGQESQETHLPVSFEEHYIRDNKVSSSLFSDSVFSDNGKYRTEDTLSDKFFPTSAQESSSQFPIKNENESVIDNTLIHGNGKLRLSDDFIRVSDFAPKKDILHSSQDVLEKEKKTPLSTAQVLDSPKKASTKKQTFSYLKNPPEAWEAIYKLLHSKAKILTSSQQGNITAPVLKENGGSPGNFVSGTNEEKKESKTNIKKTNLTELGRQWFYNRFMNPRSYDLGKQGRISFNKKLGLTIASDQLTLTGLDVLYATDYLIKVEKGVYNIDDIDHLKNRRVRTSGELIQIQIGIGLVRLEKFMRYNESHLTTGGIDLSNKSIIPSLSIKKNKPLNEIDTVRSPDGRRTSAGPFVPNQFSVHEPVLVDADQKNSTPEGLGNEVSVNSLSQNLGRRPSPMVNSQLQLPFEKKTGGLAETKFPRPIKKGLTSSSSSSSSSIINHKAFNSAIREFFGTSPLSQFMDQINPLAELTHKRRLSSMGPGGVTRDTATLAIRGIHPTHYGRICPIETPEGKNTGLVNSMTTYAMVNSSGILESPFYKVYKGQVQKNTGMYYLNAEEEEQIKLAAADLSVSTIGFLPKAMIPVRMAERFTKISRSAVQYIGVSPLQMISIAASLIPFLEHDDANRALMGSNMQRQAVPLIRPERPIVGTGLEGRTVSDSGHVLQSQYSGLVTYVSAKKIIVS